ncbi:restriction endonuclease subunit S [uncultured Dysgonomonas sp.]|uniref:Type I restriction modification DNA specificity domain-containing protein n=1 Tax=uncultured Dysgonomonas sp. TaxID=206096 RepID=A0A212IVY8_9BACT|nr:restriction endonuclease subunit S [uncultured Dysgonomonas sp.]SBV91383.1 conserved hypothetical protein [uncultured Dysgonomonas sp.]
MRFPEFEGEWEVTFLGNECTVNPKVSTLESEFVYVDLESVVKGVLISTNHINRSEAPSRAQRVLSDKDILFQCVRPYQLNNYIYHRQGSKQWVASTGYAQIRTKHNIDFLYQLLNSPQFNQEVMLRCTGTSYPAISGTDLGNIPISICSNEEQKKIGGLLFRIDDQIATQSKIIEGLKELKAWLSKQLFSRKLRFKDENGNDFPEWVETKLGEIAETYSGGTPTSTNNSYYIGNIPFIKSGEISSDKTEQFINEEALKNSSAKMVSKGDLLLALYGATSGEVAISQIAGAINQAVLVIKSMQNTNFLHHFLRCNKENIISTYLQGGQGNLSAQIVKNITINLPSLTEQKKIADFLSEIDNKVEVETTTFDLLTKQKHYLLRQMFI